MSIDSELKGENSCPNCIAEPDIVWYGTRIPFRYTDIRLFGKFGWMIMPRVIPEIIARIFLPENSLVVKYLIVSHIKTKGINIKKEIWLKAYRHEIKATNIHFFSIIKYMPRKVKMLASIAGLNWRKEIRKEEERNGNNKMQHDRNPFRYFLRMK